MKALHFLQAAHEKSGRDEQRERARDLRDHQKIANYGVIQTGGILLATLLQDLVHIGRGGAKRRKQSYCETGAKSAGRGEGEDAPIK
jgi:hypothetical protein